MWGILSMLSSVLHSVSQLQLQACRLISGQDPLPALVREGDITLGGLFSLHDSVLEPDLSFTSEPDPTLCAE